MTAVEAAKAALDAHTRLHPHTRHGTWAEAEWHRLYVVWIGARWDAGDPWARDVWKDRPVD